VGRVAELGSLGRNISSDWVFTLFMKTTTQTVLGLLTALMLVGCATPERQSIAWEYKIVSGQVAASLQEQINKAAAEGWIFVSTASQTDTWGYAVMKRAKK
jgi:hypothetical protein